MTMIDGDDGDVVVTISSFTSIRGRQETRKSCKAQQRNDG